MAVVIVFMILVVGAFAGGMACMCRSGEKDGICQYGNEKREEETE